MKKYLTIGQIQELNELGFCININRKMDLYDIIYKLPENIGNFRLNWYISDKIIRYDDFNDGKFNILDGFSFSFNENVEEIDVFFTMLCECKRKCIL